jgi:26S proteasome regulatory subunit N9
LKNSPVDWLYQALFAFNSGDMAKFEALAAHFNKQQLLVANAPFLKQKICLMALIETVFKRTTQRKAIPFDVVAHETHLPLNEVEHLIMKALSLKIIKGSINQVEQVVNITWVQPRVLNYEQIGKLNQGIALWRQKVHHIASSVENETPELFTDQ